MPIPADAQPIYREEDNELLGYICPESGTKDLWVPLTIFGYSLDAAGPKAAATAIVKSKGLDVLMDTWWFRSTDDGEWYACQIIEAHADTLRLQITDYGHPSVHSLITLNHPSQDNFRHARPKGAK